LKRFERDAIYHALVYFEDVYYKASALKLQDKLRSGKPDEKQRDQWLALIEKDNQIAYDIIKSVRKEYAAKWHATLEPYCIHHQVENCYIYRQKK
jgi:hypothetical protein